MTLMLVRVAALVSIDAPPASYFVSLADAVELGVGTDELRDVMTAITPIVGTARITSATSKIARGIGLAIDA